VTTKIALLADAHVPGRAVRIPPKLLKEVKDFAPERILFAGDFTSIEVLRELEGLAHLDAVTGERDFLELPGEFMLEIEGIKFGMIHGNEVMPAGNLEELENLAKAMDVQVLVSGHSHQVVAHKGRCVLLNPGSCTGVPLPGEPAQNPSAILLKVAPGELSAKIVELGAGGRISEKTVGISLK
jgi:uncharacterized protein